MSRFGLGKQLRAIRAREARDAEAMRQDGDLGKPDDPVKTRGDRLMREQVISPELGAPSEPATTPARRTRPATSRKSTRSSPHNESHDANAPVVSRATTKSKPRSSRVVLRDILADLRAKAPSGRAAVEGWMAERGWKPWPFQKQAWDLQEVGRSGLIQVPTGAGKTYAAYLGLLAGVIDECLQSPAEEPVPPQGLRILYLTPLRSVSRDIELALKAPIQDLGLPIIVESRTGDTKASLRAKQRERLPNVLITTPESLSLLLTRENVAELFAPLRGVILDEWHELISSKRGTQVELALAALRTISPDLRTWALSATLPNLETAAAAAVGLGCAAPARRPIPARVAPAIVRGSMERPIHIKSILPRAGEPFPWAGHLGLTMLPRVLEQLNPDVSTLIFTNTRSQAELWFQAIRVARPQWEHVMALHHGSLERDERERVEAGLKSGEIRLVIATSSLDLGVDFAPVQRVIQISSVKGIARLLQRAGRASHRPGEACEIFCVPTHGLELLEIDAARRAVAEGRIEPRLPLDKPLDVLAQHLVTRAIGGGFLPAELFDELRTAYAYRDLTREEFDWTLDLVRQGGLTLRAYDQFRKVHESHGRFTATTPAVTRLHKLNVGTIVGEGVVEIRYLRGRRIGTIEENFIGRMKPGDRFLFAGKMLSFVAMRDMVALVKPASGKTNYTPHWGGTKLPISEALSQGVRESLERVRDGLCDSPELKAATPLLRVQQTLSRIPRAEELLIERTATREGQHCFLFPFDGRGVHAGLAAILALRLTRRRPGTFTISVNDYGLELLTAQDYPFQELLSPELFSTQALAADAIESVNMGSLAKLQFREIARVAGLVPASYPGSRKTGRQMQANASLIFDVFKEFDPENLLLHQATREVLGKHFEQTRLARGMDRLSKCHWIFAYTRRPTPLAFPLIVERVAAEMSSESLAQRIENMRLDWEKDAATQSPRSSP